MDSASSTFGDAYEAQVRPMLKLVEDLNDLLEGHQTDVVESLPRIAVVGNQSSGKSSLLQRISSVPLPQADGLCTRAPLTLSMRTGKEEIAQIAWVADSKKGSFFQLETQAQEGKRDISIQAIPHEIKEATHLVAGESNNISSQPIKVYLEGPKLPDLTLIDLPGIVYVAKAGQPDDIGDSVRTLILDTIRPENTIILCVFAGNQDLETSEALKLARQVDPKGIRTIGVITKIDLVPKQQQASLQNKIMQIGKDNLNIKLGLIAVCNWVTENDAQGYAHDAENKERRFLQSISGLKQVPQEYLGVPALVEKLCHLQCNHVKGTLPQIGEKLQVAVHASKSALEQIKGCLTEKESYYHFQDHVARLSNVMRNMACGNYVAVDQVAPEIPRLHPLVQRTLESFQSELCKTAPDIFGATCEQEAQKELQNASGLALPNFLSHETCNSLIRKWQQPYKQLVLEAFQYTFTQVLEVANKLVETMSPSELKVFIGQQATQILTEQYKRGQQHLKVLLDMESCIVDTLNPQYSEAMAKLQKFSASKDSGLKEAEVSSISEEQGGNMDVKNLLKKLQSLPSNPDPNDLKVMTLQMSAYCYDMVVRRRLADNLLLTVKYCFIAYMGDELGLQMSRSATQEQAHMMLGLSEKDAAIQKRHQLTIKACQQGIDRIKDYMGLGGAIWHNVPFGVSKMEVPGWAKPSPTLGDEEEDAKKAMPSAALSKL